MAESSKKRARKSLAEAFPSLTITPTSSSVTEPSSPIRRRSMSHRFKATVTSLYSPSQATVQGSMTIRMDDVYRTYGTGQDPKELFEKARGWLSACQEHCKDLATNSKKQETLLNSLHQMMIEAIFGSNVIERVGLGYDVTFDLCSKVLRGEDVGPTPIPDRDEKYHGDIVAWVQKKEPALSSAPAQHILRSRNEVVQHAKAMQHIIDVFVIQEQPMTEDLLKDTHRILMTGVPLQTSEQEIPWEAYAGKYRTVVVGAGRTCFTPPQFVPKQMTKLIADLQSDIKKAEEARSIDPVALAAKHAMDFVQIHPFQDGNGRMCRLILNAIMFRYTFTMVPLGQYGDGDRDEWIGVSARASEECLGAGELSTLVLKGWGPKLRRLKKKLCGKRNGNNER